MAEGTIKKLAEKGFGFISSDGGDVFFHMSSLSELRFEDLSVGQKVEYEIGDGPKGPRAENVRVVD
jgi:cold shock protein